jgi:hypothetical protein
MKATPVSHPSADTSNTVIHPALQFLASSSLHIRCVPACTRPHVQLDKAVDTGTKQEVPSTAQRCVGVKSQNGVVWEGDLGRVVHAEGLHGFQPHVGHKCKHTLQHKTSTNLKHNRIKVAHKAKKHLENVQILGIKQRGK